MWGHRESRGDALRADRQVGVITIPTTEYAYNSIARIPATEFVYNDHRAGVTHEIPGDAEAELGNYNSTGTSCGMSVTKADRDGYYDLCTECTGKDQ